MATPYTPSEVIDIAKLSQFYASDAIAKGSLFGRELSPMLHKILYTERKSLEWAYNLDPSISSLQNVANYVYKLCGRFGARAIASLGNGGGTVITPTTPTSLGISFEYLIPITAADFSTATDYNSSKIAGKQLEVYWTNVNNYETSYGWRLIYTPTGFTVFVDDGNGNNAFDAFGANSDAEFKIYIVNPTGTVAPTSTGLVMPLYEGIGGETFFELDVLKDKTTVAVVRGTPYGVLMNTGTPSVGVCVYTATLGKIDFGAGNPISAGEQILVVAY